MKTTLIYSLLIAIISGAVLIGMDEFYSLVRGFRFDFFLGLFFLIGMYFYFKQTVRFTWKQNILGFSLVTLCYVVLPGDLMEMLYPSSGIRTMNDLVQDQISHFYIYGISFAFFMVRVMLKKEAS